jgi:hypothetical protein
MRDMRNAFRILIGKSEWKRAHGRPRCNWEDNTEMDLRGIGLEDLNWLNLARVGDQ